jgi:hypothetical protein
MILLLWPSMQLFYTWILIHQKLKFSTNWEGVLIKVSVVLLLVLHLLVMLHTLVISVLSIYLSLDRSLRFLKFPVLKLQIQIDPKCQFNLWVIFLGAVGVSPTSGQDSNGGYCSGKRWFGMEIATGGVLIWCFISSHLFII